MGDVLEILPGGSGGGRTGPPPALGLFRAFVSEARLASLFPELSPAEVAALKRRPEARDPRRHLFFRGSPEPAPAPSDPAHDSTASFSASGLRCAGPPTPRPPAGPAAAAAAEHWARQARDLAVLEAAKRRDRGNRGGTWTPEEVAAADRIDELYEIDDQGPLGASFHLWEE